MNKVQQVDSALIDDLLAQEHAAPRLRKNLNFHERESHPSQRLQILRPCASQYRNQREQFGAGAAVSKAL